MLGRSRVLVVLFVLTASGAGAEARQPGQTPPPAPTPTRRPSLRELAAMPVVYRVAGMDEAAVRSDIKYTRAAGPHLLMDVYAPPRLAKGERRPAVFFIHGSVPPGSPAKDMGVFRSWGRLAAASGMVGVTFTHRLGFPRPMFAEAAADVASAVEYVRANADALGVDRERVCLVAFSGGGPLLSAAVRSRPPYVRCLVAFYAFLDVRQSEVHRAHETAETLQSFSPVTHLTGATAPLFIARAGLDEVPTLNDSIDRFALAALRANAPVTLANHPRGVHAFDIFTDDERSREIIRDALSFMRTHLGAP